MNLRESGPEKEDGCECWEKTLREKVRRRSHCRKASEKNLEKAGAGGRLKRSGRTTWSGAERLRFERGVIIFLKVAEGVGRGTSTFEVLIV